MAIISYKHNLIIVRPPKTGSSSFHLSVVDSGILGEDDIYSGLNLMRNQGYVPTKGIYRHNTPQMLLDKKHITEEQLRSFKILTTIRQPISRYISAFFFSTKLRRKPNNLKTFKRLINKPNTAKRFVNSLGPCQSAYFKVDGKYLTNMLVVPTPKINECAKHLIDKYNGKYVEHDLKSDIKPEWAKPHYTEWLDQTHIDILEDILQKENEEYQYVMTNNQYKI